MNNAFDKHFTIYWLYILVLLVLNLDGCKFHGNIRQIIVEIESKNESATLDLAHYLEQVADLGVEFLPNRRHLFWRYKNRWFTEFCVISASACVVRSRIDHVWLIQ